MRHAFGILLAALLALAGVVAAPAPACAGGIVTVCDEPHLLAALAGGGNVTFGCSGTITLTQTITIASDTTIDGSGQSVTISGNHAALLFRVDSGRSVDVTALNFADGIVLVNYGTLNLSNCIFSGGSRVVSSGTLIANDSTFSGSTDTHPIYNSGTLTVRKCAFSANTSPYGHGGGIYNDGGTLTVSNSTFSDNSARDGGGGILNSKGVVEVNNCLFSDNTTDGGGGAIHNYGGRLTVGKSTFSNNSASSGGAIYSLAGGWVYPATLTVGGSTFYGNAATGGPTGRGGGIYFEGDGALNVSNSTFSGNSATNQGAGLCFAWPEGQATVRNSTFSGNSAAYGSGISGFAGVVVLKNTILANNSVGNCSGRVTNGGGNLNYPYMEECPGINADPVLGPLQDNGGPTYTMALLTGSAAIDAADDAICAAEPVNNRDQRGLVRPQGAHCDIGAFEMFQANTYRYLPVTMR